MKYSRTLWFGNVLKTCYFSDLQKIIKNHGFYQKQKLLHTKIFLSQKKLLGFLAL